MKFRYILTSLVTALVLTYAVPSSAGSISGSITTGGDTVCGSGSCTMTSTDSTYSILRFVFDSPVLFGDLTDITATALSLASTLSVLRASLIVDGYGGNDRNFLITNIVAEDAAAPVPESTSLLLLGTGLVGVAFWLRKRTKAIKS